MYELLLDEERWMSLLLLECVIIYNVLLQAKVEVAEEAINVDDIPIESLDLGVDIEISKGIDGLASADRYYLESVAAEKNKKKQKRYNNLTEMSI